MARPAGCSVGMSFIEWTAMSMRPSASASSISRVNRPLPPRVESGRSCTRSPVVRIAVMAKAASGRPWAAISRSRVSRAWARASGLPRVPIRSGRAGSGRSSGIGVPFPGAICKVAAARPQGGERHGRTAADAGAGRRGAAGAAGLADAAGRALPARIPGDAGAGRELPRPVLHAGSRRRGDVAADPAVRLRRGDPVRRHPAGSARAWRGARASSRARGRGCRR